MHPLDLIKTRLQIQSKVIDKHDPRSYNGILDCFKKMYRHEGLTSFWKGILPPILAETPKRAVKVTYPALHFYTNFIYKLLLFSFLLLNNINSFSYLVLPHLPLW